MRALFRGLALLVILLLVPGLAAGVTTYDLAIDGDRAAMNITVELYPDDPSKATRYSTSWRLPDGTTVTSVEDSEGKIDFEQTGSQVSFETDIPAGQEKEVVTLHATVTGIVSKSYRGVDLVQLQLSGFNDRDPSVPEEVTQVRLETERALLAGSHSFGFESAFSGHAANYSGEGPVNLHLSVSDGGEEYRNLVLFGEGNLSTADDLYWIPVAVTGFHPAVNRYPVIVYGDDRYDEVVDPWSAGQYRTGGLIFIRKSTLESDHGPAVVLHEVVHGFNDHALNWYQADRAWFDEGTAKYVEWLVNAKREVPQAEIFGEEVTWQCGPRTRCRYEPRGTPDDLWDFYQRNASFLATWNPLQSDAETRRFGYALSELVVRDYVRQHGPAALRDAYSDIRDLNQELDTEIGGKEATRRLKRIMGTDFRPCYATERSQFEQCLDTIHAMEPEVPELGDVDRDVQRVDIKPIEEPEKPNATVPDRVVETVREGRSFVDDLDRLTAFLRKAVQWVLQLFGSG